MGVDDASRPYPRVEQPNQEVDAMPNPIRRLVPARRLSTGFVLFALAGCVVGSGEDAGGEAAWSEAFPTFHAHTIAEFQSGYHGIAADIDGDGLQDVVALSTGASRLTWFKNPTWEPHEIVVGTGRFIHMAPYDVNGDGRLDLALASEFNLGDSNSGGLVHWAEAPADPVGTETWTLHPIDAVPTSHRIQWADLDGDGRKELVNLPIIGVGAVSPEYVGAAELRAYSIPADPSGPWEVRILEDEMLEVAHGLEAFDWEGDGIDDLLVASSVGVTLFRPREGGAAVDGVRIGEGREGPRPDRGASEVGVGQLGPEGRFVAAVEPWHGSEVVVYRPGAAGAFPWERTVIETELTGGHALVTADLNGDGYDEIIAGGRSGSRSLLIFRYRPDTRAWERIPLDLGGVAVSSLDVADLNGDGLPDILAIGSGTHNIVWYENAGTP